MVQAEIAPVAYNVFTTLPLDANSTQRLDIALPQLAEMKALVLLTVEPNEGLSAVTYAEIGKLGYYIKQAQLVRSAADLCQVPECYNQHHSLSKTTGFRSCPIGYA